MENTKKTELEAVLNSIPKDKLALLINYIAEKVETKVLDMFINSAKNATVTL